MSLNRKRKKELRKLQAQANNLWESQQVLVSEAAGIAREAGRQLGNFNREQLIPGVQAGVDKSKQFSKQVLSDKVVPTAGAVVGSALSVWDAANDTRSRLAAGKGFQLPDAAAYAKKADKYGAKATKKIASKLTVLDPPKQGIGAGGVIAIVLGVAAAVGVLYAAWQTLRADDELWVADDPLRAPDA
ncbi:DNA helicase [Microbacterium lacus]|uniref:DNA helicase n=1 Tax=Microbacterium lacus TaxID=415217 RepID=A0ABP4RXM4_9MICO